MAPKKPTGETGPIAIDPDGRGTRYCRIQYPTKKDEIEDLFVGAAFQSPESQYWKDLQLTEPPIRNQEDDFDYTLETAKGKQFLELTEVAPLQVFGGSFDNIPFGYVNGPMADAIWENVLRKGDHYGDSSDTIHLMMYATDMRLRITNPLATILSHYAKRDSHPFCSIVSVAFIGPVELHGTRLFPQPGLTFREADIATLKKGQMRMADPTKMEISDDGKTVSMPLGKVFGPPE